MSCDFRDTGHSPLLVLIRKASSFSTREGTHSRGDRGRRCGGSLSCAKGLMPKSHFLCKATETNEDGRPRIQHRFPHGKMKKLAERAGFEPAVRFDSYDGLANRSFRPLRHLSARIRSRRNIERFLKKSSESGNFSEETGVRNESGRKTKRKS